MSATFKFRRENFPPIEFGSADMRTIKKKANEKGEKEARERSLEVAPKFTFLFLPSSSGAAGIRELENWSEQRATNHFTTHHSEPSEYQFQLYLLMDDPLEQLGGSMII